MITLQDFINKVKEKENNKVKITTIEVEGFGEIEFQRPSDEELLRYNNEILNCFKGDIRNENIGKEIDISMVDMEKMVLNASTFIYNSCSFFRAKEIRDMYKENEFTKIPLLILENSETLKIANELNAVFKGKSTKEEVEKEIKN